MYSFKCLNCGSTNLGYRQCVELVAPVAIDSDIRTEFENAIINLGNRSDAANGFVCQNCINPLYLHGSPVETNEQLIEFLNTPIEDRFVWDSHDFDSSDDQILDEGEIIYPDKLEDVMLRASYKAYRSCAYTEEEYDTDERVMWFVDKWVNEENLPLLLADYLYENEYHSCPATVKANLQYVNTAMKEEGYHLWVDITPEQIRERVKELTSSEA